MSAVAISEREVSIAWEPAQIGHAQAQQIFVSADYGNSWKYNAVADEGPMLSPHSGSLSGECQALLKTRSTFMLYDDLVS